MGAEIQNTADKVTVLIRVFLLSELQTSLFDLILKQGTCSHSIVRLDFLMIKSVE